ncbi:HAMP domain-containing sensor histidine kinase [uncultured Nocardioides sp.]|uniref:sensor histidine kinase n=1 Tax=uncultured Nocardioides sp. TaxID=198441 RepID=UPI002688CE57|nr:HAMP domain-containing histidine kinase [Nocardioides sp.]
MPAQRPVQPPILEPDLLRVLGHELRSPLASLLGYAELMSDEDEQADPPAVGRFVGAVARNARRQLDLVEDVLLAVALDTGALTPVAEACSPMRALSLSLDALPPDVHVSALDLVEAPPVLADPALLARCLGLLVRRAVACGTDAEITWDWSVDGDLLLLRLHCAAEAATDHEGFLRATPRGSDGCAAGSGLEGALALGLVSLLGGRLSADQGGGRLMAELRLPVAR